MFLAGRFLLGMGTNISQGSAPVLVVELAHPQHRGTITTMYNVIYSLGAIIAAWTVCQSIEGTQYRSLIAT
jgi:fucose permease